MTRYLWVTNVVLILCVILSLTSALNLTVTDANSGGSFKVLFDFSQEDPNLPPTLSTWSTPHAVNTDDSSFLDNGRPPLYQSHWFLELGGPAFHKKPAHEPRQKTMSCTFAPDQMEVRFHFSLAPLEPGALNTTYRLAAHGIDSRNPSDHHLYIDFRAIAPRWELRCESNELFGFGAGFFITTFTAGLTQLSPPTRGSSWLSTVGANQHIPVSMHYPMIGVAMIEVTGFENDRPFIYDGQKPQDGLNVADADGMIFFARPMFALVSILDDHAFWSGVTVRYPTWTRAVPAGEMTCSLAIGLNSWLIHDLGEPLVEIDIASDNAMPMLIISLNITGINGGYLPSLSIPLAVRNSIHANAFHFNYLPFISIFLHRWDVLTAIACQTPNCFLEHDMAPFTVQQQDQHCLSSRFGGYCHLQHCVEVKTPHTAITLAHDAWLLTPAETAQMKTRQPIKCTSFSPWYIITDLPFLTYEDHPTLFKYTVEYSALDLLSKVIFTATQFGMNTIDLWIEKLYFYEKIGEAPDGVVNLSTTPIGIPVIYTTLPGPTPVPLRIAVATTRYKLSTMLTRGRDYYVSESPTETFSVNQTRYGMVVQVK